jgi:hypothetical protein
MPRLRKVIMRSDPAAWCVRCRQQGIIWRKALACILETSEPLCAIHLKVAMRQRVKTY